MKRVKLTVVRLELTRGTFSFMESNNARCLRCAPPAPTFSLNDDMSGGTLLSLTLEVFLCVGFGAIVAPLGRLIYCRSRSQLVFGCSGAPLTFVRVFEIFSTGGQKTKSRSIPLGSRNYNVIADLSLDVWTKRPRGGLLSTMRAHSRAKVVYDLSTYWQDKGGAAAPAYDLSANDVNNLGLRIQFKNWPRDPGCVYSADATGDNRAT